MLFRSEKSYTIELTGDAPKLDAFLQASIVVANSVCKQICEVAFDNLQAVLE